MMDTLPRHVAALQQWLSTCAGEIPERAALP